MMYRAVSVYWISVLLVPSVAQQMSARVVGGTADAGRLEILYDGTWGSVCGYSFGPIEALVACRMLGFNSTTAVAVGSAKYGPGSGPILFSYLQCVGNETSLAQCQRWGLYRRECEHWQDVGVVCNFTQQMSARVVGGTDDAGRLEILYDGTWGTVCGKRFGQREALVACRMLGFDSTTAVAVGSTKYGAGSGPVLFTYLQCVGNETSLAQCQHSGLYRHDCQHWQDVGVMCNITTPMTARLYGGTSTAGRLEISVNGEWTTVCEGGFGQSEVEVACRMLGCNSTGQAAVKSLLYNDGSQFRFGYINCQGMETSLQQCDIGQLNKSSCLDVGIIYEFKSLSLRLTGPRRTDSNMGRVEVEIGSKQFSTVCVNNEKTAAVICRQLNLTSNGAALVDGWVFGANKSPLLEAGFFCDGNENSLFECGWNKSTKDCYSDDVGVVCSKDYTLYIVSETEKYPFMEGTKGVLMCVKPRKYIRVLEYTWSGKDDGRSQGNRLFYDNLKREYNGREVFCEALYPDGASGPGERLQSGLFVLNVYYKPLITITWTNNTGEQQPLSSLSELNPGHNVTLWCKADSNPPPASITWSGRVNSTTGELRILAADHVTHSGVYTCTVVTHTVDDDDRLPLTSSYNVTVGVQDLEPRLTGAHRIRQDVGRVEVRYNGTWGAVCGHVSNNCATVICRRLGHSFVMAVTTSRVSPFGPRPEESFVVTDLQCTGRETSVALCVQNFIGLSDRCESEELGVICTEEASYLYIVLATTASYPLLEGSNVSLKCESARTFPPVTNFTWPKSGGGRAAGQFLIFDHVTKGHNKGQVMCAALYQDNTTQLVYSDTSILQVYYAPSITIISEALTCTTQTSLEQVCGVTRGHNATFVCEADSNPPPASFQWFRARQRAATQEFTIAAADPAMHDGFYHCFVETGLGAGDSRLPLSSHYMHPPAVVSFQLNGENQIAIVNESSNVNMICVANGRPAPRMMIVRGSDGQELKVRHQGEIGFDEERRDLAFFLCKAECEESGDYRCEVDNGVGHDNKTIRLLVPCAPRRKGSEGKYQYLGIRSNNRNFSINMIAYPTPQAVVHLAYPSSVFKSSVERPLMNDTILVTCAARPLTPAEVTCHIGVTQANEGVYQVLFSNDLGNFTVGFTVISDADEDNTQDSNKQSDTAVIAGAAVAGAAVVGLSASSSLLFWKKRKRQRLLAEQEKHRHEEGSFRPLHDPDDEETYVEIPDVGDQPAPGDEYGYSEIQDGTDKGRGHQPPLPKRDGQRTENGENPYDQANSSSEDVRPGSSKKATKKVSMNLNGAEIPYDVCRDTEQRRSSSETSSQESPASSSPSSKGNESESYTYPGSQHGQKEDYLTPAPSSPGAQKTGSRSLAAAVVKGADYLTPTSAERQGQTQVVTAEVNRADDYLTPTSDTTVEGVKVATDDVGRADDYLTPTSNTSAEGKQAATAADYYLTPTSGETRDTAEVAPANDYLTPAPGKSEKGSTPGVPDDKQAHIYTPLLQQPKNPQFVLSEEMKKAGYLTPVHIPTTPDTQETDSTISDRKKAGYLTPVEVPGSPELGTKGQEKPAPSQDVKKPQDYLTPVSSSSSPSSSSVAAPAKKKKEKSSMIPLAEFWSSKRLSSQRKSPPSSEGETEATHTYEKMGNVKYTEPGNDPAYTKIGEVPVTVSTDPDPSSYQNC